MKKRWYPLLSFLVLCAACKPDADFVAPHSGDADFRHVITIGDNFMSGYQDGAFLADGQEHSVGALLSRQFEIAGAAKLKQVLIII